MVITEDIKGVVRVARLELYNHGLACGAKAVQRRLDDIYQVKPLPSVRTIGCILASEGLTHSRTGSYEGE